MVRKIVFGVCLLSACFVATTSRSSSLDNSLHWFPHYRSIPSKLMESIKIGVQLAVENCQSQFKWSRWNCPITSFTRQNRQTQTKEIAFTRALTAAGIVYQITKNCSQGQIKGCGCDLSRQIEPTLNKTHSEKKEIENYVTENARIDEEEYKKEEEEIRNRERDWSWGGCSQDTSYAFKVAKEFLDNFEKGTTSEVYVMKHNNKIGHQIVKDTMKKTCRCHGVSGSCSVQTCWMQVAPFPEIASKLHEKYKKAAKMDSELENRSQMRNSARYHNKNEAVHRNVLLYLEPSPNYCIANFTIDWPGVKNRECSRNRKLSIVTERRSCRNICIACGLKVKKIKTKIVKRCNCKFSWCCEVTCETCVEIVEEYKCE